MPGSKGSPPGGDRPAGVHGGTPSPDPLPGEEETDRFFRTVPASRSTQATAPAWAARLAALPRPRPRVLVAIVVAGLAAVTAVLPRIRVLGLVLLPAGRFTGIGTERATAEQRCRPRFPALVYNGSGEQAGEFRAVVPSGRAWADGARLAVCAEVLA